MQCSLISRIKHREVNHEEIGKWVKDKRTNVLVLRFIASLFVIGVHLRFILNKGYSSNSISFSIVECITVTGVDIFIICTAISSYMKSKNNYKRYLILVGILYLWSFSVQLQNIIMHNDIDYLALFIPFFFGKDLWYLRAYVVFYPLIPIINKGLKDFNLAIMFIIFYMIFTITQSFDIREFNISSGYHILHFIFLYMFTRSMMIVFFNYFDKRKWILIISGSLYLLFLLSNILTTYYIKSNTRYSDYPVIFMATSFSIFFMFLDFKKNKFNKFICFLGRNSLWFYILDNRFSCIHKWGISGWFGNMNNSCVCVCEYLCAFILKTLIIILIIVVFHFIYIGISKLISKKKAKNAEYIICNK